MLFKVFVLLLICINLGIAQSVQVAGIEKVIGYEKGGYFHPKFTSDGNSLIFTKSGSKKMDRIDRIIYWILDPRCWIEDNTKSR